MNDTEKLSEQLYDKALNEMNAFLDDLKTKPPEEIIENAYKITVRQDLMVILESEDFSPYEIEVLANLDHPLQVLYEQWVSTEDRHMEDLRDSMQSYFDTALQYQANKLYTNPATPRYEGLYHEAKEKGEVHLYRASRNRDWACINAFTEHISDANENRRMREFVQKWTHEFGHDRCKFLLGYTVQRADWDGRYSAAAKREAATLQNDDRHWFDVHNAIIVALRGLFVGAEQLGKTPLWLNIQPAFLIAHLITSLAGHAEAQASVWCVPVPSAVQRHSSPDMGGRWCETPRTGRAGR